ncbi:restriction endonuclease [Campylobacter sp. MG1]|uniref:restriction endonuclease n=1 Tax=Campylobacter sp. MG1 TaxID=2976332 RepID=UPI00226D0D13|nr:restriction endonuclease [Campylobacter sp. MG1]
MFPNELNDIKEYLIRQNFNLEQVTNDGRLNSAFNEDQIINLIQMRFGNIIGIPKVRYWYDFCIQTENAFYPVNIKVSTTTTADNLNCKLGIYYSLTGIMPTFNNIVSWDMYFKNLKEHITNNDKDYYFLIINKNDYNDIFLCSLRTLNKLTPNGNNLPFQATWEENKIPINRDYESAKYFILNHFSQSLHKRAEATNYFKKYFPEFL